MSKLGPFELDTIVVGDCLDVMEWAHEYDGDKFHA